MPPPPKKLPGEESIQLNRTFDTVSEMNTYVETQMPGFRVSKFWNTVHIHCIVTGNPEAKVEKKKGPPPKVAEAQSKIEAAKKQTGPPPQSIVKSYKLGIDKKQQKDLFS